MGGGAGATRALGEFLRLAERPAIRAAAPLRGPWWSLLGRLLLMTPLCGPQMEPWLLAPIAEVGRPPGGSPRGSRIGCFLRLGCTPAQAAWEPLAAAQVGCGLGGRQGRGGWWEGAILGPFCSAPRQWRWGPLPLGDASQSCCGTREAPSAFSPGPSVDSAGEASACPLQAGGSVCEARRQWCRLGQMVPLGHQPARVSSQAAV